MGAGCALGEPSMGRERGSPFLVCCPRGIMQELRSPGVWLADLASSDAGCSPHPPPTPSLPGAPALVYWLAHTKTRRKKKNNSSPRRKEGARTQAAPRGILSDSLLSGADFSSVRLPPTSDPGLAGPSSSPHPGASHSVHSLTHTGHGWAGSWRGPLGLRGPGLSLLLILPLTSWGTWGPRPVARAWSGGRGHSHGRCGESHAGTGNK